MNMLMSQSVNDIRFHENNYETCRPAISDETFYHMWHRINVSEFPARNASRRVRLLLADNFGYKSTSSVVGRDEEKADSRLGTLIAMGLTSDKARARVSIG